MQDVLREGERTQTIYQHIQNHNYKKVIHNFFNFIIERIFCYRHQNFDSDIETVRNVGWIILNRKVTLFFVLQIIN